MGTVKIDDQLNSAEFLKELREDARFQMVMAEVINQRPVIPPFFPGKADADNDALVENIKFSSGRQQGFDLLFGILTGVLPT